VTEDGRRSATASRPWEVLVVRVGGDVATPPASVEATDRGGRPHSVRCTEARTGPGRTDARGFEQQVAAADGFVLVLDGRALEPARDAESRSGLGSAVDPNRMLIRALARVAQETTHDTDALTRRVLARWTRRTRSLARIDKPVAVVPRDLVGATREIGPLRRYLDDPDHGATEPNDGSAAVDRLIRELIRRWQGPETENLLSNTFAQVRYVPERGSDQVASALAWLLSTWGLAPLRDAQARP
jgi:hypothetical protein